MMHECCIEIWKIKDLLYYYGLQGGTWASCWFINSGHGVVPKNSIEFFLKDYGF